MARRCLKPALYALLALALAASAIIPLVAPSLSAEGPEVMFFVIVLVGYAVGFTTWRPRRAAAMLAISFVTGILIENIGIGTGFPFGPFRHTMPGPYIGLAPLVTGFGYFPFIAIGSTFADLVVDRPSRSAGALTAVRIALAALVGGMVEMTYDPVEALLLSRWEYPAGGSFFGTPASNLFGWGITIVAALALFELLVLRKHPVETAEKRDDLSTLLCVALVVEPLPLLICHALAPAEMVADATGVLWDSSVLFGVMGTFGLVSLGIVSLVGLLCVRGTVLLTHQGVSREPSP